MSTNHDETGSFYCNPYQQHKEFFNAVCTPSPTTIALNELNSLYNWEIVYGDHNNIIEGMFIMTDMYATTTIDGNLFIAVYNRGRYYLYYVYNNPSPSNSYLPSRTLNLFSSATYNAKLFDYNNPDRDFVFVSYANELLSNYLYETSVIDDLHERGILTKGYCKTNDDFNITKHC